MKKIFAFILGGIVLSFVMGNANGCSDKKNSAIHDSSFSKVKTDKLIEAYLNYYNTTEELLETLDRKYHWTDDTSSFKSLEHFEAGYELDLAYREL